MRYSSAIEGVPWERWVLRNFSEMRVHARISFIVTNNLPSFVTLIRCFIGRSKPLGRVEEFSQAVFHKEVKIQRSPGTPSGDPPEHLAGDRRLAGLMDFEELPPAMRPTEGEGDGPHIIRDGILFAGQPLEAAPAVDLQYAGVVGQHLAGAVPDPVLGVDVGHRRRQVALPGAVIPGDAPEIASPGPALAGCQHR